MMMNEQSLEVLAHLLDATTQQYTYIYFWTTVQVSPVVLEEPLHHRPLGLWLLTTWLLQLVPLAADLEH
jgi:hypothetical protein